MQIPLPLPLRLAPGRTNARQVMQLIDYIIRVCQERACLFSSSDNGI